MKENFNPSIPQPKFDGISRTFITSEDTAYVGAASDFMSGHPDYATKTLGKFGITSEGREIKMRVRDAESEGLRHDTIHENGQEQIIIFRPNSQAA